MQDIVVAGHICVDITPALPADTVIEPGALVEVGPVSVTLGGCVANAGGNLVNLGVPVRLVGTIADDELGATVRRMLLGRGMSSSELLVTAEAQTSYSLVFQADGADRTFWHYAGANAFFDGTAVDLTGARLLHVGYPPLLRGLLPEQGLPLRRLLSRARSAGITTSLDMAVVDPDSEVGALDWAGILRAILPQLDIFSPSIDDLTSALKIDEEVSAGLVEQLAERFIEAGVAVVAISAGAKGQYLRTGSAERLATGGLVLEPLSPAWANQSFWQEPAVVREVVTTNGAGDAVSAGLLFGLWSGMEPADATQFAAACAAATISGLATREETVTRIRQGLTSPSIETVAV